MFPGEPLPHPHPPTWSQGQQFEVQFQVPLPNPPVKLNLTWVGWYRCSLHQQVSGGEVQPYTAKHIWGLNRNGRPMYIPQGKWYWHCLVLLVECWGWVSLGLYQVRCVVGPSSSMVPCSWKQVGKMHHQAFWVAFVSGYAVHLPLPFVHCCAYCIKSAFEAFVQPGSRLDSSAKIKL